MPTKEVQANIDENRVRLLYFKHRGNLIEISKESGLSFAKVKKIAASIKTERDNDVVRFVGGNITQMLVMGYQQRVAFLQEYLTMLDGQRKVPMSACCRGPVRKTKKLWVCEDCKNNCKIDMVDCAEAYPLLLRIIESLRREDESMVGFAVKLGYALPDDIPPPVVEEIGEQEQKKLIASKEEAKEKLGETVVKGSEMLSALEREKLRLHLTKQVDKLTVAEVKPAAKKSKKKKTTKKNGKKTTITKR